MNKRQKKKLHKTIWPIGSRMWLDNNRLFPASDGYYNDGNYTFKIVNGIIVQEICNYEQTTKEKKR